MFYFSWKKALLGSVQREFFMLLRGDPKNIQEQQQQKIHHHVYSLSLLTACHNEIKHGYSLCGLNLK